MFNSAPISVAMSKDILRRGRLASPPDEQVTAFTSSMESDRWIFDADIRVDQAHVVMLERQGILDHTTASKILTGLQRIAGEGIDALDASYEDVHIALEARLIQLIGEDAGGRMHSGRSRNDEVATCIRIALREQLLAIAERLNQLRAVFINRAEEHLETLMPGFTHLQHAQPTTLAHHLLAHACALERDFERMLDAYRRVNRCPLGAAAFTSTGFPLDRDYVCELLGFDALLENSMDAVSTRDFIIEAIAACANLMTDLTRFTEETILWSTSEFNFIELDDAYSSTSSIMPQKKNPDVSELLRGKTGTVYGALISVLSICKALPYSYNRDLQEATPHLQRAVNITEAAVGITTGMLSTLTVHRERMLKSSAEGLSTATELADTIVRRTGLPFRTAHQIVGAAVREGRLDFRGILEIAGRITGENLEALGLSKADVTDALDPRLNIQRRSLIGGPAPEECRRSIAARRRQLEEDNSALSSLARKLEDSERRLEEAIESLMEQ